MNVITAIMIVCVVIKVPKWNWQSNMATPRVPNIVAKCLFLYEKLSCRSDGVQ